MKVVAVVLTFNEEQHLPRCLNSLQGVVDQVVVVDCFSTDQTVAIAKQAEATVLQREWLNHADQFNWGLTQLDSATDWVLRVDADEIISPELSRSIREQLPLLPDDIDGVYCGRRMTFLRKPIHYGGLFPIRVLRLFRAGRGECENRWMDEHIVVQGKTTSFEGEILDDNLNSLSWWIDKHNRYASREAVEMLNLRHGFLQASEDAPKVEPASQTGFKRWLKEKLYARLPGGLRALMYFLYRYFVRLGFLDGGAGAAFHVLQGFWYRYLVDAKIAEVEACMRRESVDAVEAIRRVLEIDLQRAR